MQTFLSSTGGGYMAKVGRPRKYTKEDIEDIIEKFELYVDNTELPIVCEFAYTNNILRESLYDYPEFSTVLKKCTSKKEAQLEKLAAFNLINVSMAIFSLKQLGWKDRQEIDMGNKNDKPIKIKWE
jgi:hypothetical protein